ncbi:leucine-rich repeat-containing protein 4-like isoform X1 [Schistocerca gregaria]|uniref:leucine-rich repeat-containing protein 4-like isoform X1 n=2 Tax=Schistocerca gregaria TaxID=7010 RepID=UPI00211EFCE8|nr:leucine-rich repeat-containing protein 4-like isoform X1 [Schistocerca gregaria]XP_049863396.1 leucine-rich repeat-containing protein 4-like isoform X1 [Schistocerca gregaria]XP_049863397.1 leucine-rich repeat-containing protein 4-like isoform X1 [Schistocerca gregaria]XP_049863398.1 leucine-rich repeat-containing protein 4-like isoform X1 [Schistocerca gregaria]
MCARSYERMCARRGGRGGGSGGGVGGGGCVSALAAAAAALLALLACLGAAGAARSPDFCPVGCSCDDKTLVVTCIETNLDVIPITLNPAIQRLVLKHNRIKTVHAAFQFYGELHYVDLSHNHLLSIPAGSFEAQRKLAELRLDHNKLSNVTARTWQGLAALTALSLRRNYLEELAAAQFASLPLLEELDLGENRLQRVDARAFAGLGALRVLYLDDNQLRALPTPALQPLASLAELRVGANVFPQLHDDAFKGLSRLTVLDVSGAGVQNVSARAFRGLSGLRRLSLAGNQLRTVPSQQLAALDRLEELSIGQNDFVSIDKNAFQGLTQLRRLEVVAAPRLERVCAGALSANLNLESVTLSSNKKLQALEAGALAGLPKLQELVLRDNALVALPEALMAAWPQLRRLDLSDNPLHCHCSLLWLRDVLATSNASQVTCASPAHLRDRHLRQLTADDLGCALPASRRQALLGAVGGGCLALVAVLVGLACHYRRRLCAALKEHRFKKKRQAKEHEYQKTFSSDDEYMVRGLHQPPTVAGGAHQLKPIPVTEL